MGPLMCISIEKFNYEFTGYLNIVYILSQRDAWNKDCILSIVQLLLYAEAV